MGNTWEVNSWKETAHGTHSYVLVYSGESLLESIWIAIKEKRSGVGCVKIEWRGQRRTNRTSLEVTRRKVYQ